jgi:hypothetical protein
MKIAFREIAKRLTGISTPILGVSWNPPIQEADIATALVNYLESRRVLFTPFHEERQDFALASVVEMRERLIDALGQLPRSSDLTLILRDMRDACQRFLSATQFLDTPGRRERPNRSGGQSGRNEFTIALSSLRRDLSAPIARLSLRYGIDLDTDLATQVFRFAERAEK